MPNFPRGFFHIFSICYSKNYNLNPPTQVCREVEVARQLNPGSTSEMHNFLAWQLHKINFCLRNMFRNCNTQLQFHQAFGAETWVDSDFSGLQLRPSSPSGIFDLLQCDWLSSAGYILPIMLCFSRSRSAMLCRWNDAPKCSSEIEYNRVRRSLHSNISQSNHQQLQCLLCVFGEVG
jgi:hypothetical protein